MERRLVRALGQFPAVLVSGARQVGKTALCRHVWPSANYVTLDIPFEADGAERDADLDAFAWPGGWPELRARPELERELWLGSYLTTYLERDVRNMLNVGSLRDFDRFLRATGYRVRQIAFVE